MIQQLSRTTFPSLFRSGSERTGIGGGDNDDGSDRPKKMTLNRFSSSLRKTTLFRSSSSYKNKTKNSTTSKDDDADWNPTHHSMRTDAQTVTQLTPSPHYAPRPVLTTEQPPGGNHRSIPTVPELCIPNINNSTTTTTNNNNRSSSSRSQQLRLARIYSSRRSIEDDEQEQEQAYDDHPDFPLEDSTSLLFQSPPIQVVEIPQDFTHAKALGLTTERKQNNTTVRNSSSHNSKTNMRRVLDRPPPRFGDWDDHTIASTTSCSKDVTTDYSREGKSSRTATVSVHTARDVITSFVDRHQRRRRTRSIRSVPTTPAPMTNENHGPQPQQQQQLNENLEQQQLNNNLEQQQTRGVKWNMVPPQQTTASPQPLPQGQPRVVRWNMVQPQPQPQQESEQQQQQQPPRVVKWNSVR